MLRPFPVAFVVAGLLSGCALDLFNTPVASEIDPYQRRFSPKDYFPFVKGAEWTYEAKSGPPIYEKTTTTIKMTDVEEIDSQLVAKVKKTYITSLPNEEIISSAEETYIKSNVGIFAHGSITGYVDPVVYFPLELGTRKVDTASTSISPNKIGEVWRNEMSDTDVHVSVATSDWSNDCFSVERTYTIDNIAISPPDPATRSFKVSKTTILGAGIGPVKFIQNSDGNERVDTLATFSIPVR